MPEGPHTEQQIPESDVGKRVVYDGDTIGELVDYRAGTAYVAPDPDVTDGLGSTLARASDSDETYP